MNNALIKNHAVSGRPAARLAGLVRHGVVACVLACTAAGAMANGQDRNVRRDEMQQQQQQPMRERYDQRAQDQRYEMQMREESRRQHDQAMRDQQVREERRGARMTPDERRDLRRQINEANVELYPNARRR